MHALFDEGTNYSIIMSFSSMSTF